MADSPHPWADRLSDFIDGHLGPEEAEQLLHHVQECETCAVSVVELTLVRDRLAADGPTAADSAAPQHWPALQARLRQARKPRAVRRWGLAAAASLVLSLFVGSRLLRQPVNVDQTTSRADPPDLEQLFHAGEKQLPAAERAQLASALAILDRAIAETQQAESKYPHDHLITTFLRTLELRKADALREAVEIIQARS